MSYRFYSYRHMALACVVKHQWINPIPNPARLWPFAQTLSSNALHSGLETKFKHPIVKGV